MENNNVLILRINNGDYDDVFKLCYYNKDNKEEVENVQKIIDCLKYYKDLNLDSTKQYPAFHEISDIIDFLDLDEEIIYFLESVSMLPINYDELRDRFFIADIISLHFANIDWKDII